MTRVDSGRTCSMSSSDHDHVASPYLELVALDELGVRHLALAVRAPFLLLDPCLTFGVQLIERNRAARLGGRETP